MKNTSESEFDPVITFYSRANSRKNIEFYVTPSRNLIIIIDDVDRETMTVTLDHNDRDTLAQWLMDMTNL